MTLCLRKSGLTPQLRLFLTAAQEDITFARDDFLSVEHSKGESLVHDKTLIFRVDIKILTAAHGSLVFANKEGSKSEFALADNQGVEVDGIGQAIVAAWDSSAPDENFLKVKRWARTIVKPLVNSWLQ